MTELFILITLTSIWNLGIEIVTSEDMALHWIKVKAEESGSKLAEVAVWCVWCRPTIHSLFGYTIAYISGIIPQLSWGLLFIYTLVVAGSSLVSGFVWSLYKMIEVRIAYYKHMEQDAYFNLKERKARYLKTTKT